MSTVANGPINLQLSFSDSVSSQGQLVDRELRKTREHLLNTNLFGRKLAATCEEVSRVYRECSESGWDGGSAEPLKWETVLKAREFLSTLPAGIKTPEIAPDAQGHIHLEWYASPYRVFSVSIGPETGFYYAGLFGTARVRGYESFGVPVPAFILQQIRRVYE
jgi:hypothetical protein